MVICRGLLFLGNGKKPSATQGWQGRSFRGAVWKEKLHKDLELHLLCSEYRILRFGWGVGCSPGRAGGTHHPVRGPNKDTLGSSYWHRSFS